MHTRRINGHGHILPEPEQIPSFMKKKRLFWIDDDRGFMRQGEWRRPITDPSFFLSEKLSWMESNQIDHGVMITLSQLYCNGYDVSDTCDTIRFQNDFHGQLQAEHGDKLTCGFVVQPLHMDDALKEVERCVETLGLKLLCLPTHYMQADGQWASTVTPEVFPLFELADHYGLAVEIHPYDAPKMIQLKDQFWRFHLVWMMAQTADTLHLFGLHDMPRRFPNIRTCFAHGCMLGQANYGRRVQGYKGRPDLFEGVTHPKETLGHPNVFFDTLVHDPYTLQLLKHRVGTDQIVAGLDDPYPLGEMESVPDCHPGQVLDDAVVLGILDDTERAQIWKDNVLRWLGDAYAGD
ncbi:MAG: amidohydrolase [Deltaproteobacteria bacterium]|nr:amidohydrolase [Deltaproteobacteria bacterium]